MSVGSMSVISVWRRGLAAALRLAFMDPRGANLLPIDRAGAWASFAPLALVIPLALAQQYFGAHHPLPLDLPDEQRQEIAALMAKARTPLGLAQSLLGMVIEQCLFFLLGERVLRLRGLGPLFPRFVAANNWCNLISQAVVTPVALLPLVLPMSDAAAMALSMTALIWALLYQTYTLRHALGVGWLLAVGLVLMDTTLSDLTMTIVHTPLIGAYLG